MYAVCVSVCVSMPWHVCEDLVFYVYHVGLGTSGTKSAPACACCKTLSLDKLPNWLNNINFNIHI